MSGLSARASRPASNIAAVALGLLAACNLASASSSLSVAPIRVNLSESRPTQALTLRNAGDLPVVVQVTAVRWSQTDGADQFDETRDILVTPAVLTLAPDRPQIVRVAMRAGFDATLEKSYRVFLQEVPPAENPTGAVRVALRLSLPVFAAPVGAAPAPRINWAAHRDADGRLALTASNSGTAHLQIVDLGLQVGGRALAAPEDGYRYVLPGAAAQWTLTSPLDGVRATDLTVRGRSTAGEFAAPVAWSGH